MLFAHEVVMWNVGSSSVLGVSALAQICWVLWDIISAPNSSKCCIINIHFILQIRSYRFSNRQVRDSFL